MDACRWQGAGRIFFAIDHAPLLSSSDLRNRVGLTPVGQTIRLTILRNGSRQTVDVKIESAG